MLYVYYAAINILTLIMYGIDKLKAVRNEWRLSEATLLLPAILGGAYGALVGMFFFRHKIRKAKFVVLIPLFAIAHTIIIYLVK